MYCCCLVPCCNVLRCNALPLIAAVTCGTAHGAAHSPETSVIVTHVILPSLHLFSCCATQPQRLFVCLHPSRSSTVSDTHTHTHTKMLPHTTLTSRLRGREPQQCCSVSWLLLLLLQSLCCVDGRHQCCFSSAAPGVPWLPCRCMTACCMACSSPSILDKSYTCRVFLCQVHISTESAVIRNDRPKH
jgi:hypothetical protein